ncbi:MAG: glycosyltransferase [Acidimicrobiia bacterium]|nr:glycosyltransferase [Acidimicrobiia bacterium]
MVERRVLWLVKGLGPGGAERLLVGAASAHDTQRFAFDCAYLLPWKDALVADLEKRGVGTRCLGVRREQDLRWAGRLRRLLREQHYDVLHAHSPYAAAVARLVVRSLPRRHRPRLVYTTHNTWKSFRWPTRLFNAVTLPLDDAEIVISEEARATVWRPLRRRCEVVVHGVVLDEVRAARGERAAVRAELGLADDEVAVGTVANYRAQKDWPNLLGAARRLVDDGVPVRFVAIGQGPLEDEVHALHERLALGDRVLLLGMRDDAVRVMAGCDVFALASAWEGLPVAVMEALALGLPVVATEVGGLARMVTEGVEGLLVPPGRPDLLAAAIASLAVDPERRVQMGAAASLRAESFDIANAVRRIEEIYEEVLAP